MDTARSRPDVDVAISGGDGPSYSLPPASPEVDEALDAAGSDLNDRLWHALRVLYRRRWLIVLVTALTGAAAVALTLQIPNRYRAETRVLLPEGGGGLLGAALSNLPPAAAALVGGGGGGGFTRYMAILTSPSTLGSVVDRFDLVSVYQTQDKPDPRGAAIRELFARAEFEVSLDYDYLAITVLDEDPERSAQLSNYFVQRLNERNIQFTSSSAAANRKSLEERLDRARLDLDSAQAEMQGLQERSGVIQPEAQAEALMASLAAGQAQIALAEAQYQSLLSQYGPDNSDVAAARAGLSSARSQVEALSNGSDAIMPVPIRQLPQIQRQYQDVMQELLVQQQIIETIQPLYEQAVLEERRDADAVQVLDVASAPTQKAWPRRSLIVLAATLSAFLIAVTLVLTLNAIRRHRGLVMTRLRA